MHRAIIFDLGKVLIDFDFQRAYRTLESLCPYPAAEIPKRLAATNLIERFETGLVEPRDFVEQFSGILDLPLDYDRFCRIWSGIFTVTLIPESMLEGLAARYRLLLLSNTNALHFEMQGVGVGEQQQAVPRRQAFEHAFGDQGHGEDAAPDAAEAVVIQGQVQNAGELFDEIPGFYQAGFEALDEVGGGEALGDLGRRVRAEALQRTVGALEIEIDENLSQVEDDGSVHANSGPSSNQDPVRTSAQPVPGSRFPGRHIEP